ncbi:MAG: hypothetical protein J6B71_11025 [Clostridia bacterium]|nr:hypothetical protein [Clostridia bacterium]
MSLLTSFQKKFLICPCSEDADYVTVVIYQKNKIVCTTPARLSTREHAQYFCAIDVEDFIGQKDVVLRVEPCHSKRDIPKNPDISQAELDRLQSALFESDTVETSHKFRPWIHFTTISGWHNDPNGLFWMDGTYHMYFQKQPTSLRPIWDQPFQWGHAVSNDLFNWIELSPVIRFPPASSGSAFINRQNGNICISHNCKIEESSDKGYRYQPIAEHPLIGADPKIFWHEDLQKYVCVSLDSQGEYRISHSEDLHNWTEQSHIYGYHECPDLIKLPIVGTDESKWVLYGGDLGYRIGNFDGYSFIPDKMEENRKDTFIPMRALSIERAEVLDKYNGVFTYPEAYIAYSGQTFANLPDERWIRMIWLRKFYTDEGVPFSQCMCVPQELSLRYTPLGLRLCCMPVKEIEQYYLESVSLCEKTIDQSFFGAAFDVKAEFYAGQILQVGALSFRYDREQETIFISGDQKEIAFAYPIGDGKIKLRCIADCGIFEFYIGEGEIYYPVRTDEHSETLIVRCEENVAVTVTSLAKACYR